MSDAHARATPRGTSKDYPALHHRVTASPHDSGVGMAIGKMPPAVPGGRVSPGATAALGGRPATGHDPSVSIAFRLMLWPE
jgi:hypothetical protein